MQPIKYITATLTLALLIASCKVSKDYQRPTLELPSQFSRESFADTASIADIQWKNFFTDTTLQGLIQKGITYNQDLLVALNNIDIAQQRVLQARLLQLPSADFAVTGQYNRPSKNSLNGVSANSFLGKNHIENYLANASISWEADVWGKIRGQKEAALKQYLQTREAANAVQTQLVADIANGYYNLLMLDKQLQVTRRNLALSDSFVTATRLLRNAGNTTTLAVQQAEAQKQSTALLLPQIEQAIALQENALQVLTGQLPGAVARQATLSSAVPHDSLSTGLPVALVSRRPDVREAELALQVANAQVGIAHASMYPSLIITASGGLESFKASNWLNIPGSLFGLAAGSIAQPIFNRRQLKTDFEVAKLQREQAVIRFRQRVLIATEEVENSLVQNEKLKEQQQVVTAQADTLQQAIVNARLLFRADMANYLEVITAQSNALQAELNQASIQRQQLSANVELYRALGGGWK